MFATKMNFFQPIKIPPFKKILFHEYNYNPLVIRPSKDIIDKFFSKTSDTFKPSIKFINNKYFFSLDSLQHKDDFFALATDSPLDSPIVNTDTVKRQSFVKNIIDYSKKYGIQKNGRFLAGNNIYPYQIPINNFVIPQTVIKSDITMIIFVLFILYMLCG